MNHHFEILHQIKQCIKLRLPLEGKKLHAHVVKSGFDLHGPLFSNTLLYMYGKCGFLKDALQLFDEMPHRDLASWASIFTSHNHANLPQKTLFLYSTAASKGNLQPDDFIYATLFNACAGCNALKVGEQLHAQFIASSFADNDVVKSSLVDFYAKCGLPDRAHSVFNSIVLKNVVCWTSLIYGYAKAGRKSEALALLRDTPCKNSQTWTALISGLMQGGLCLDSFKIFKELRLEGAYVDEPFILSSLIVGSATLAMLELGKQVHRLVIGFGYESNLYVSNSLIDMYAKCSDVSAAEMIFGNMGKRDVVSWTSIIVGMAQHGRAFEALSLYEKMALAGVKPNGVTFTGIIYACSHAGLVEKGRHIFNSMVADHGLRPSLHHYTCLVDLYARSGLIEEAKDILDTMPFTPDEAAWASLLSSCCQGGKKEIGVRIADHLLELGPEDTSTCILLSNVYARAAMWEQVSRVRKLMYSMEWRKKPGYSCVDLGKEIQVFYAGETEHPMRDEIFALMKELDAEIRKRGYVPDTSLVLHDLQHQEKERQLFWHSERSALAYGLLKSAPGASIRIMKNLRVCGDCHTVFKLISNVVGRELIVRDVNRFHHFKDGECSCRDFW
ncbi:pentatricopeptide repeat-containing protein At4g14050, mitochondrial-like [Salvia splendens]|uniref:pentatricopeptide repeat-containing protein At4g14050, mitochondrial-like n=1 Tax=Salvia splendens TaxID=180675 RepID=UPI001C26F580|nr:pentatricopeptide repeat-containing protein At4g14050, mitochondrial-like [Salvia splendens]